jgi:hypothetical protein
MSRYWYSPLSTSITASLTTAQVPVSEADLMFILGALEPLTNPENWDVDPEVDRGGLTEDEYKSMLVGRMDGLISAIFDPVV